MTPRVALDAGDGAEAESPAAAAGFNEGMGAVVVATGSAVRDVICGRGVAVTCATTAVVGLRHGVGTGSTKEPVTSLLRR